MRLITVLVFVVFVLFGITTSSVGISELRQDPANPLGWQFGRSRPIRSDEIHAFSAIVISILATHGAPSLSPLAARADLVHRFPTDGFFEQFVFFDSTMLRAAAFIPEHMLFAAHWWLPSLILLMAMPTWFQQLGRSRRFGWLAAILIVLSPSNAWWSLMPVALIAYTLGGCVLMIAAFQRFAKGQRLAPVALAVLGGILIAGLPTFYAPWSLLLGLPVLVASTLWILLRGADWAPRLKSTLITGGTAAVFGFGTLFENRDGLQALLNTVYPGSRRVESDPQPLGRLLGAPALGPLQYSEPVGINASELSSSFTVVFVWILVILLAAQWRLTFRDNIVEWTFGTWSALWIVWITVDLGPLSQKLPLLNLVTPPRAGQVVGVLAVILLGLLLSRWPPPTSWRVPLLAGAACGLATGYAASLLKASDLPSLSPMLILLVSAGVGVVVAAVTKYPQRLWPLAFCIVLAALPVARANPVLVGLGDLRASDTARAVAAQAPAARSEGKLWAADTPSLNTLLLTNGMPSLSGLQRSGPDAAAWQKLDPESAFANKWNRGGGYIFFAWTPGHPTTYVTNDFDAVGVSIDPCTLKNAWQNLDKIVSSQPLEAACLTLDSELQWQGKPAYVYAVR
ncbi:hypothetical protein GU243_07485 [Pseudarthrobacter psychrotolerans]|uniref:Glycosyltransferase RgtA/B/C/D-like domain-containing protein n=1 Tax=Pseudarthrobacter psychrotolerans TaxID=2697569 RepID=A0A6P1NH25_9MICC|nr:hypothetical protein [Pseudarthrobacter psychrotolerans]QHK19606.1 hypothetical protein GU243_07485 [Pseudarthrobacter psychrotolerans]